MSRQLSFASPETRVRDVLERAAAVAADVDSVALMCSGGTDSVLAAYLAAVLGPEYGLEPDVLCHANTGVAVPQTQLVAKTLAALLGVPYVEGNNRTVFKRVVEDGHGWPARGDEGHFLERVERKDDVFDKFYSLLPGRQLWISGARSTESKNRSTNVPDSGVEEDSRRARQTWASPITGLTSAEKGDLVLALDLPVSQTYRYLGISAECVACSYDDARLLGELDLIAPNLAWALRNVISLLATLALRGDVDLTPKQLCWGWDPKTDDTVDYDGQRDLEGDDADTSGRWIGCNVASCEDREVPAWIDDVPDWQIVDRQDVATVSNGHGGDVVDRFRSRIDLGADPFDAATAGGGYA